ncbi:MAG: amidophosphoribosyltransferase [Bacteroidales bacterium]|nr:amidophosphoribosyltransferase [Bacteroidales bacterium]
MPERTLHEECGVFGAIGVDNAYDVVMTGLAALQHRGQEGCGIAYADAQGELCVDKGPGLVFRVFAQVTPGSHPGRCAIGHVRYGTSGGREADNIQPFAFRQGGEDYAIAHNGNIVNASELKSAMGRRGVLFRSSSDSEILGHLVKMSPHGKAAISAEALSLALNQIEGAFSYLVLTPDRLYAARDKHGFRPLSIGRIGDGYAFSSETCALDAVGAQYLRDVEPGELVTADASGLRARRWSKYRRNALCAMEYIYFARPDSDIEGVNVHSFRKESGRILYEENPVEADMVFGVPDSGLSPAIGYSERSGIPLETGVIKNFYVGRTFIQPTQQMRETGVRLKLTPVRSVVKGKDVVVIDDSIVRGTTSRQLVKMLRDAGARQVHLRISSPPLKHPCFYGIDISSEQELISARLDVEEVRRFIGADSLAFLSEEGLLRAGHRADLCMACFDGNYPTALYSFR